MKKSIIPVAAFIAGMAIVPSVFALPEEQAATQYKTATDLASCLGTTEETATCVLSEDYDESGAIDDITITGDVTLDLNGNKIKFNNGKKLTVNGELTIVSDDEALVTFDDATTGDAIVVSDKASLVIGNNVTVDSGAKALAVNSKGEVTINGEINGAYGIWMSAGKTTVNGIVDTDGYAVKVSGGDLIAEGATLNAVNGNALLILSEAAPTNAITVNISKSTLASEENDTIAVVGNDVTTPLDYKTFGLSVKNKDDAKKYGALKSFVLANVDLSTEGEDKHVYNNNGKVTFAEWSVDGKTSTEANLAALTAYNTIDDAVVDPTDEPEDPTDDAENPNTADTIATYLTIATVALLGLGATAFVAKKSNR